jgi:hypothetical protein
MKKTAVLVLLATFVALPAAAQKPLHFMASQTLSYDDNIYLTDKNTKDSMISTTRVGADYKANIPSTGLMLNADAGVGYNAYTEKHNKNNYWEALGGFGISNDQLKLGDRVLYTSDPANSSLDERKKRLNNTGYFSYVTSHEKMFGVGILASDSFDRYYDADMQYLNRNRLNLGAQLFYNLSPKTHFFAEYIYSDIDYQKSEGKINNSHGHSLGLGVEGQVAAKVTGTAKVTYDMRDYEKNKEGLDKYNDLVGYYVALAWKPTTRDVVRLSGARRMEETRYGNNRYFADTLVSLYGSHKLTDKFTAALNVSWENMHYAKSYNGKKRNDDLWTIRPELDYQFKEWLSAGVWYQFRLRNSNDHRRGGAYAGQSYDYNSNKAGVFVKAVF